VLSVDLSLAGFSVKLYDTAGLRETEERVEQEGIRRAREVIERADLILLLSETASGFDSLSDITSDGTAVLRVATKIDRDDRQWSPDEADVLISTRTGEGMDRLLDEIAAHLPDLSGRTSLALPSRRRHVDSLRQALRAIEESLAGQHYGLDIRAEQLRLAGDAIGRITGRVDVENLLDVIFSEFCIGK